MNNSCLFENRLFFFEHGRSNILVFYGFLFSWRDSTRDKNKNRGKQGSKAPHAPLSPRMGPVGFQWQSHSQMSHEKNLALLSMKSWLVNRDSYNGLL